MKNSLLFLGTAFLFGASSALANVVQIRCEKGTGFAQVYTEYGPRKFLYPQNGPIQTSIAYSQSFTWGWATGGGDLGDYIALGARVLLTRNNQIRLMQGSDVYGKPLTDRIVPSGHYRFTTEKGHSIRCSLRLASS
jgi:hypothetical protein